MTDSKRPGRVPTAELAALRMALDTLSGPDLVRLVEEIAQLEALLALAAAVERDVLIAESVLK